MIHPIRADNWLMTNPGLVSIPQRLLPMLEWIPGYQREWLAPDSLRHGTRGDGLFWDCRCTANHGPLYDRAGVSRLRVVARRAGYSDSALIVGAVAAHGTTEFNSLTSTLAVLIGVFFLFFGIAHMGWSPASSSHQSCVAFSKAGFT